MKFRVLAGATVLVLFTAACAQNGGYGTKQTVGALGGAALGGWAGSTIGHGNGRLAATAAGALIGALVGSEIGRTMDDVDRMKASIASSLLSFRDSPRDPRPHIVSLSLEHPNVRLCLTGYSVRCQIFSDT